ncbi:hypothetical protein [Pseudarthrobacter sp. AG30]|uniref:hypothetical protein n=1 Tax=Pseudarthrobacter sp. AG30 TaxID=2249742 RepID=UPI001403A6A4|nr:hypothetical protein [Pseudarthrobacter sp. AG30]
MDGDVHWALLLGLVSLAPLQHLPLLRLDCLVRDHLEALRVRYIGGPSLISTDDTVTNRRSNHKIEDIEKDGATHRQEDNEIQRTSIHNSPKDVHLCSNQIEHSLNWLTARSKQSK